VNDERGEQWRAFYEERSQEWRCFCEEQSLWWKQFHLQEMEKANCLCFIVVMITAAGAFVAGLISARLMP
jgi:hypothetical protein